MPAGAHCGKVCGRRASAVTHDESTLAVYKQSSSADLLNSSARLPSLDDANIKAMEAVWTTVSMLSD